MNGKVFLSKFALFAVGLFASSCSSAGMLSLSPTPGSVASALPSRAAAPSNEPWIAIAFVKDGNIQLWDESTGQVKTILKTGDVIAVTMSDDGAVIAFLRRSVVQRAETERFEQSALWAVDRNGGNPGNLFPQRPCVNVSIRREEIPPILPRWNGFPGRIGRSAANGAPWAASNATQRKSWAAEVSPPPS